MMMKLKRYFWGMMTILSFFSLFALSCSTTTRNNPTQEGTTADFPEMKIGDSWTKSTYKGKIFSKVIQVNSDGSFVIESRNETINESFHYFYDNKYMLRKKIDLKTGKLDDRIARPPFKFLNFPLYVGKTWQDINYAESIDKVMREYKFKYVVKSFEKVKTKAGMFEAFKIVRYYSVIDDLRAEGNRRPAVYWYSPDLKTIVKLKPYTVKDLELLGYSMAK
jgi:hypothetical protein